MTGRRPASIWPVALVLLVAAAALTAWWAPLFECPSCAWTTGPTVPTVSRLPIVSLLFPSRNFCMRCSNRGRITLFNLWFGRTEVPDDPDPGALPPGR